jgi:protein-tyrosine phosphatase
MLDIASQNIRQFFDESFDFIEETLKDDKNGLLVHCNAGVSRSTSFVIAYLLQKGIFRTYGDALHYVRKRRPVVSPNYGFEKQLLKLERKCKKKNKTCKMM